MNMARRRDCPTAIFALFTASESRLFELSYHCLELIFDRSNTSFWLILEAPSGLVFEKLFGKRSQDEVIASVLRKERVIAGEDQVRIGKRR
jgi:hypothetical protein